jgi:heme/copper-type cytochrome/quinol oxidase subunit 2
MRNLLLLAQTFNYDKLPHTRVDNGTVQNLLNIVFVIVGAVSVMMVVIGGIKYAASQGDPQATAKAKGTIIYAVVGLVLAIFAVAIVDFVFGRVA